MEKKRVEYFDIAKGISILLVIMGHTITTPIINKLIFSFHMPIFFLISGYFFHKKSQEICLRQNIKRLIVPYVFTCIGVIISNLMVSVILNNTNTIWDVTKRYIFASFYGSGNDQESPFYIPQIGAIWFLLAMFFALIILNSIIEVRNYLIIVAVLAYVGYKTAQFLWLPFSIQAALVALLFLALGYECRKQGYLERNISLGWRFFIAIVWILSFIYGGRLYLVRCFFGNGFFDIVGALCGSYIILRVSMYFERGGGYISKLLGFLGKNTLPILCFHLIELNTFPWWKVQEVFAQRGYAHYGIVILLLKYIWMFVALILVYKISFLKKIFGVK